MTPEQILEEISEMEWLSDSPVIGQSVVSPDKLAAFLAKHLKV